MPRLFCDAYVGGHNIPIMNQLVVFGSDGITVEDITDPALILALQRHNPAIQRVRHTSVEVDEEPTPIVSVKQLKQMVSEEEEYETTEEEKYVKVDVVPATLQTSISFQEDGSLTTSLHTTPISAGMDAVQEEGWLEKARSVFPGASDEQLKQFQGALSLGGVVVSDAPISEKSVQVSEEKKEESITEEPVVPLEAKVRLYAVAKSLSMSTKEFLQRTKKMGYSFRNSHNMITKTEAEEVKKAIEKSLEDEMKELEKRASGKSREKVKSAPVPS